MMPAPGRTGRRAVSWPAMSAAWLCASIATSGEDALAQNGDSFRDASVSSVDYAAARYSSGVDCAALVSGSNDDFSILAAEVPEDLSGAPPHCRITGVIPAEILFEVNLPLDWNGRFYMYGNGGFAGSPPSSRADVRNEALRNRFATAYTNTGHDARRQPGASFAHNDLQKTIDYLFRAVHLTSLRARELIGSFYGRPPEYAYWDGCSMGGRQGMVSAQRFPEDFDGIVAGAPAFDFTGTMLSYVWQSRALEETALGLDKVDLLADFVYERCDARDGLADGLISDPRHCDFEPDRDLPRCGAGDDGAACFTPEEISVLAKLYSGPAHAGRSLHPGIVPGTEARGPARTPTGVESSIRGWEPWLIRSEGPSFQRMMVESFLKYLAFEVDDPGFELADFDFAAYPDEMDPLTMKLLDAKEADLGRFRQRGGKIITYFGWSDAAINPLPMVDYYESLEAAMGAPPHDFYRLYMIPGMFHCDGGVGADELDYMTPVIEWVENGSPPESLLGRHVRDGAVQFSRPQCPYPQVAQYRGSGDVDAASSFRCELPQ